MKRYYNETLEQMLAKVDDGGMEQFSRGERAVIWAYRYSKEYDILVIDDFRPNEVDDAVALLKKAEIKQFVILPGASDSMDVIYNLCVNCVARIVGVIEYDKPQKGILFEL